VRTTGSGVNNDAGRSIAVDASGNIYVVGSLVSTGTGSDITTIKYSQDGNILWMMQYNRQANSGDKGKELVLDAAGNIYVTGSTNIPNTAYGTDITTIKYNPAGVQQWVMHYNPNGLADAPNSITLDNQGNVIVAGTSTGTGPALGDYITIKYDNNGNQQWASRYNYQNNNDAVNDVTADASGNVYVTGFSESILGGDDYATIKYNTSGVQQWVQRYTSSGNDHDEAFAIAVDGSGSVYVTGQAAISTSDYLTIKYNSSGVQQWLAVYNNGSTDGAVDLELDANNNLYVSGFSIGTGTSYDYVTIKYSQLVGIEPVSSEIPNEFLLLQNYPNPFNPVTNIEFSIPKNSSVKITVYNSSGKEIETIVNGELSAGTYNVDWNASKYPSGVYFYKLTAGSFINTKKMIFVK
jgi:sugar lactone lactonase YvrE